MAIYSMPASASQLADRPAQPLGTLTRRPVKALCSVWGLRKFAKITHFVLLALSELPG
jgi:hypothetical protein